MHYKFLSEVGGKYGTETVTHIMNGSQPLRQALLISMAGNVLRRRTAYALALNARGLQSTRVSAGILQKVAALQQAAQAPASAVSDAQLAQAKAAYEGQLKHFRNNGGVLNRDGKLNWADSDRLVVYDHTAAAQNLTRIRIQGGLMYSDDACTKPFDTSEMSTVHQGKLGFAVYVMSEQGNIHANVHAIGWKHHSSLLAGAATAAAGEMKVESGRLKWISNKSGHYEPDIAHFIQVLHQLQKKQVDLSAVKIELLSASGKTEFNNYGEVENWIKPEEDYYHAKMIGYINSYPFAHITAVLTGNGWRTPTYGEYTSGKQGILNAAGAVVDHKLVCQYFKGQGLICDPMVNPNLLKTANQDGRHGKA